jgi:hypothetical protein
MRENWLPVFMMFAYLFALIYCGLLVYQPMQMAKMIFKGRPQKLRLLENPQTSASALRWLRVFGILFAIGTLYCAYFSFRGYIR